MPTATPEAIEELTRSVLARMNADLPASERITIDRSTVIMGNGGALDSLGIANFIVGMEEALENSFGASVSLSDQDLDGLFGAPSVTVSAFATFVHNRLNN